MYESYTWSVYSEPVRIPVTTRLDEATVEALDQAVIAGLGPNRGALVSAAVREWLALHSEEAIATSYKHRYTAPDPEHDELVAKLGAFSAAACLAADAD